MNKLIIAIDGTSASGKGTLSKLLAKEFHLAYLDTGLMYRYLAYSVKQNNCLEDSDKILLLATTLNFSSISNVEQLKTDEIASIASQYIAKLPAVREVLNKYQIDFGNNPKNFVKESIQGAILDGRDIGTKIFPNANFKFFINASLTERANRRYKELSTHKSVNYDDIFQSLQKRDESDKLNGTLNKSQDAIEIDTTLLNINQAYDKLKSYLIGINTDY